ncbi:UDP-glucuronic acid decarboxylase 1 [Penicillium longicatenatum]|uniref:UDP-glucuronic acid decarboxylase 1 n=1 Tax=Penicillium longicatenatum TaxID=1561947 RepID=UPI002546A26E|nr:UDP-glucuronic acid decarboxylase 1 [Penicillium longicatenatum]KAJ5640024.1 UDP-glucuronic acid decarboxylase 1 [Penicillium longicatenatum]
MLRTLVTGAAGFLGSNLVDFLLQKGHVVIGLDNLTTGSPLNLRHLENHPNFTFINQNICSPIDWNEEIDQIYNLACPASPIQYQRQPVSTLNTCFDGTRNLLELARNRNIRILHTSTSEVYGDPLIHPQPETYWGNVNPFGPRSCYDEGKRVAEALCYAYQEQYNLDIRIARIFNTYGPRMSGQDGRVISNFIASALNGNTLSIYGDGLATRSFQYVTDCLEGLYRLMNSGYDAGPVNIGNDKEFKIQEVADLVIELVSEITNKPRATVPFHSKLLDDPSVRRPQVSLAKKELGWEAVVPLRDGLWKTIEWHMDQQGLPK